MKSLLGITYCLVIATVGCEQAQPKTEINPASETTTTVSDLVFNVEGLTWGAVSGLGWGSRLAPVLEQLEKVDGVKSAMANHTGSLVRISFTESADSGVVAAELEAILEKQNRKPKQLTGDQISKAIKSEQWREADKVGELSEIEFRTVFERRVKQFTETGDLDEATVANLLEFSKEVLDETSASDSDTNWGDFCNGLVSRMMEKAKTVLTEEQLEELAKKLRASIVG